MLASLCMHLCLLQVGFNGQGSSVRSMS
jgi:hypothetical protein